MIKQDAGQSTASANAEDQLPIHKFVVNLPSSFYRPNINPEMVWWSSEPVANPVGYERGKTHIVEYDLKLNSGRNITLIRRNSVDPKTGRPVKRFFVREEGQLREERDVPSGEWPLFGADELSKDAPVVVTEGAKAAAALQAKGIQAVGLLSMPTNPATLEPLRGHTVILWPDNDETGVMLMSRVAKGLMGIAGMLLLLKWTDGPYKADAADFEGDVKAFFNTAEPIDPLFLTMADESPFKKAPHAPTTMRSARRMHSEIKGGKR